MNRWIFVFLLGCLGMAGCSEKHKQAPLPISQQLIPIYDDPQEMIFSGWEGKAKDPVKPVSSSDVIWGMYSGESGYISRATDPDRFYALVREYGDTHWNRGYEFMPCMFRVTTGLHMVCDRDYDAAHPAGVLLDDLISLHYFNLDRFLVNGEYVLEYVTEQQKKNHWNFDEFEELLSEFNRMPHKLLAMQFYFQVTKAPAETGTYVFTCTYTNEDGRELTASTDPIRIQGRH